MKTITRFFILSIFSVIFISCNKSDEPSLKLQEKFDCHHEETWDSTKIHNKLIFVKSYSDGYDNYFKIKE